MTGHQVSYDNTFVRIGESVRHDDVFTIQSFTTPVNDSTIELLVMIDTLTRAAAGRITAVIPTMAMGARTRGISRVSRSPCTWPPSS